MITVYPKRHVNNELVQESIVISRPFSVTTYTEKEDIALIKGWMKEIKEFNKTLEYYNNVTNETCTLVDVEDYVLYQLEEIKNN